MFLILPVFTSKYDLNLIPPKVSESVGVLIQPFFPRMVRAAKIVFCLQCFGYFGVLIELFAVIHGDGVHSDFMYL